MEEGLLQNQGNIAEKEKTKRKTGLVIARRESEKQHRGGGKKGGVAGSSSR